MTALSDKTQDDLRDCAADLKARLDKENNFAPGTRAIYSEDGGHLAVTIVSNTSNDTREEFRLKIIAVLLPSPLLGNTDIGHEFDVFQLTSGFYAGRWHLRTIEEFRRQHSYFAEALDALG